MNLADMGTKAANENGYEVEVIEEIIKFRKKV